MEINVKVSVDLSEETKEFCLKLMSQFGSQQKASEKPVPSASSKPAPAPALTPAPAAPAPAPAAKPDNEPAKPAAEISIEALRALVAKHVNARRSDIKAKLTELGAASITQLEKSKYSEMYNFLTSLE